MANEDIIGATIAGTTGIIGIGLLAKAARKLDDDTDPEDLPKKSKNKKRDTWY